jgi:hypothetical protein
LIGCMHNVCAPPVSCNKRRYRSASKQFKNGALKQEEGDTLAKVEKLIKAVEARESTKRLESAEVIDSNKERRRLV